MIHTHCKSISGGAAGCGPCVGAVLARKQLADSLSGTKPKGIRPPVNSLLAVAPLECP